MWKKQYQQKQFYLRLKPASGLKEVIKYAQQGKALDIGAGEGRNSIFLAKNGFEVEAIDIIKEGLKKCAQMAKKYNLSITTKNIDIRKFEFKSRKYSLMLSIATIDFLKSSEIKQIIPKIKKSLQKNGIIYIAGFTTKDPVYKKFIRTKKEVEKNTFYSQKLKSYRHFFEPNELKKIFSDFDILYYKEYLKKDIHPHPHRHGIVEIIAKNKG